MVVFLHDRLAAALCPFADRLARLDGVVLEVDGAYGRIHGAEEEQQVRAALGAQKPLKLLDGEHGVGLGAVMEMVGHFGHVPRHGSAHGDADGLAGRRRGAPGHLQETRNRQDADEGKEGKHLRIASKSQHGEQRMLATHHGDLERSGEIWRGPSGARNASAAVRKRVLSKNAKQKTLE